MTRLAVDRGVGLRARIVVRRSDAFVLDVCLLYTSAFLSSAALELLATISVAMVAVSVGLRLANGSMDLHLSLIHI